MNANLDLRAIRQALEDERASLLARIANDTVLLNQSETASPDPADRAQAAASRERRSIVLAQSQRHLDQVEAALRRLAEGTYGLCAACGREISPERLSALPYATTCVACQKEHERIV